MTPNEQFQAESQRWRGRWGAGDDPRTAARQVVEDSGDTSALRETAYDLNGFEARYRLLCLVYPAHPWNISVRHTADQPLTSRRLREGR